jgi:hypothetical protein
MKPVPASLDSGTEASDIWPNKAAIKKMIG